MQNLKKNFFLRFHNKELKTQENIFKQFKKNNKKKKFFENVVMYNLKKNFFRFHQKEFKTWENRF